MENALENSKFKLKMRNVGHGDNFTMTLDNEKYFIVDTGEQKDISSGYLNSLSNKHVVISISHFHTDHYGGVFEFLNKASDYNITIDCIILPECPNHADKEVEELLDKISSFNKISIKKFAEKEGISKECNDFSKMSKLYASKDNNKEKEKIIKKYDKKFETNPDLKKQYEKFLVFSLYKTTSVERSSEIQKELKRLWGEEYDSKVALMISDPKKGFLAQKMKKKALEGKTKIISYKTDEEKNLLIEYKAEDSEYKEISAKEYFGFDIKCEIPNLEKYRKNHSEVSLKELNEENNHSVFLKTIYNDISIGFFGDGEKLWRDIMFEQGADLSCVIAKGPHHLLENGRFTQEEALKIGLTVCFGSFGNEHGLCSGDVVNWAKEIDADLVVTRDDLKPKTKNNKTVDSVLIGGDAYVEIDDKNVFVYHLNSELLIEKEIDIKKELCKIIRNDKNIKSEEKMDLYDELIETNLPGFQMKIIFSNDEKYANIKKHITEYANPSLTIYRISDLLAKHQEKLRKNAEQEKIYAKFCELKDKKYSVNKIVGILNLMERSEYENLENKYNKEKQQFNNKNKIKNENILKENGKANQEENEFFYEQNTFER